MITHHIYQSCFLIVLFCPIPNVFLDIVKFFTCVLLSSICCSQRDVIYSRLYYFAIIFRKSSVMITFNNIEHKWRILSVFALSTFDIFIWARIFWAIINDHSFIISFIIVLPFPAKLSHFYALLYYYIYKMYNNNVWWNIFGLSRYSIDFLLQRSFRLFCFSFIFIYFFLLPNLPNNCRLLLL